MYENRDWKLQENGQNTDSGFLIFTDLILSDRHILETRIY